MNEKTTDNGFVKIYEQSFLRTSNTLNHEQKITSTLETCNT